MEITNKTRQKYGLTGKEALVYETLVELGPSRVSTISQRSGLNRTALYEIIRRLLLHGLVAPASGVGKRQVYVAEHPTRLLTHLERQQRRIERTIEETKKKIQELSLSYKTVQKPSIKFFEGMEGLKQIYLDSLTSKTEILSVLDADAWDVPDFTAWGKHYNHLRTQHKIYERILALDTPKTVHWLEHYPTTLKYTRYKFIPRDSFPLFNSEMNIYEDKVLIALPMKPKRMGVLLESKEFAAILRRMFEFIWQSLPEVKKKK